MDVVISNCVLNLVPDKTKAFSEIFRVLKPGGHFCISDIVLKGTLPEKLLNEAEMYAGCVAGAMQKEDYLRVIGTAGFSSIHVRREKMVGLPQQLLESYLSGKEIEEAKRLRTGIISMTVSGIKPV
jgi:SAM-dependent methyltransferase